MPNNKTQSSTTTTDEIKLLTRLKKIKPLNWVLIAIIGASIGVALQPQMDIWMTQYDGYVAKKNGLKLAYSIENYARDNNSNWNQLSNEEKTKIKQDLIKKYLNKEISLDKKPDQQNKH